MPYVRALREPGSVFPGPDGRVDLRLQSPKRGFVIMHLTVLGASGRLGSEVVLAALDRGHSVIAHSRAAAREADSRATWVSGAFQDNDLDRALAGSETVIVTFGPRTPHDPPFCEAATCAILDAMARHGVSRLLCVTGAMVGRYDQNRTWAFRLLTRWIGWRYSAMLEDRVRQEDQIKSSASAWTIFKPCRLTTKPAGAHLRAGANVQVGLFCSVRRADLAKLLIDTAEQGSSRPEILFVKEA